MGDYRLLADIVMATGCRLEEALGMEAGDIDRSVWHVQCVRNELKTGFVAVDKTKTGRTRYVPMDPAIVRRIKATGAGRVFRDIPSTTYRKVWRAACKAGRWPRLGSSSSGYRVPGGPGCPGGHAPVLHPRSPLMAR